MITIEIPYSDLISRITDINNLIASKSGQDIEAYHRFAIMSSEKIFITELLEETLGFMALGLRNLWESHYTRTDSVVINFRSDYCKDHSLVKTILTCVIKARVIYSWQKLCGACAPVANGTEDTGLIKKLAELFNPETTIIRRITPII